MPTQLFRRHCSVALQKNKPEPEIPQTCGADATNSLWHIPHRGTNLLRRLPAPRLSRQAGRVPNRRGFRMFGAQHLGRGCLAGLSRPVGRNTCLRQAVRPLVDCVQTGGR